MIDNLAAGVEGFTSNVFLIDGERPALVDTGNGFDVVQAIEARVENLETVVLTHTHPDHVGNLDAVREAFDVNVWGFDPAARGVENRLADGENITLGDDVYTALHTPGHKDDHLCLYADGPGIVFVGDLVFQNGGFGRTDLEEGDRQLLLDSIDRLLEAVDENLAELHAGHGPSVTSNPYGSIELAYRAARM